MTHGTGRTLSQSNDSNNSCATSVYIYIGSISLIACLLMIWITAYDPGVSPDSTTYLGAAKSLLLGKGYTISNRPITHYPPLYPLVLAAASLLEISLIQASRLVNALAFGINAGLVALAVYLGTKRNLLAGICAALFFISSAELLEVHSWVLSEPLFMTFLLTCLILLALYVIRPTIRLLFTSSICLGCALLTRYAGIAFLPVAMIVVYIGGYNQRIGRRLLNTLIWLIIACAPLGVLFARNMEMAGSATNRSMTLHLISPYQYGRSYISTIINLFVPSLPTSTRLLIGGLLVTPLIVLVITLLTRRQGARYWAKMDMVMTCSLFVFSYTLFLYISKSVFDAATPMDERTLSPILVLLIVGLFAGMWAMSEKLGKPAVWWGFLFVMVFSISIKTPGAIRSAMDIHKNGLEYTSRRWQESESVAYMVSHAKKVNIYSNRAEAIEFLTGKEAILIPQKTDPETLMANHHYAEELQSMCKDITENGALLVYFNQTRWYLSPQEEIRSTCHLTVLRHFEDGTVYGDQ
jgi:hypothetical protein